jgi:hypothetical protein
MAKALEELSKQKRDRDSMQTKEEVMMTRVESTNPFKPPMTLFFLQVKRFGWKISC